jgi:hypothetical protein
VSDVPERVLNLLHGEIASRVRDDFYVICHPERAPFLVHMDGREEPLRFPYAGELKNGG